MIKSIDIYKSEKINNAIFDCIESIKLFLIGYFFLLKRRDFGLFPSFAEMKYIGESINIAYKKSKVLKIEVPLIRK